MSAAMRVIFCLNVSHGRVVKGVAFKNLDDEETLWNWLGATMNKAQMR